MCSMTAWVVSSSAATCRSFRLMRETVCPREPLEDVQDVVMAEFPDVYRLLFELIELPLLVVVMLEEKDLIPPVECTHLILAGNQVSDVRQEADDVQLIQLCGCDLAFAEEVKQTDRCCKSCTPKTALSCWPEALCSRPPSRCAPPYR